MGSYSCCSSSSKEAKKIISISSLLKIITEDTRLKLLCILRKGQHCVCEMIEHTDFSQSLISHHLRDLKEAKLVISEKKGLRVYYRLTPQGKRITNLLFKI